MNDLAVIGGSGLTAYDGLEIVRRESVDTPWGEPSAPLSHGRLNGVDIVFLARHGAPHAIPPIASTTVPTCGRCTTSEYGGSSPLPRSGESAPVSRAAPS